MDKPSKSLLAEMVPSGVSTPVTTSSVVLVDLMDVGKELKAL